MKRKRGRNLNREQRRERPAHCWASRGAKVREVAASRDLVLLADIGRRLAESRREQEFIESIGQILRATGPRRDYPG